MEAKLWTVDSMPWEVVNPSFERRLVHGERTMLAFLHLHRGCQVPRHSHHNEQASYVIEGRLRFLVGAEERGGGGGPGPGAVPAQPSAAQRRGARGHPRDRRLHPAPAGLARRDGRVSAALIAARRRAGAAQPGGRLGRERHVAGLVQPFDPDQELRAQRLDQLTDREVDASPPSDRHSLRPTRRRRAVARGPHRPVEERHAESGQEGADVGGIEAPGGAAAQRRSTAPGSALARDCSPPRADRRRRPPRRPAPRAVRSRRGRTGWSARSPGRWCDCSRLPTAERAW